MRKILLSLLGILSCQMVIAQGHLSGDLMLNGYFFNRDTSINAAGNPLYDNLLSGGEGWLSLRYANTKGFSATVRFDGFQNSNLLNPTSPTTAAGIGMFNLTQEYKGLTVSAGHIYDQIGSGILWRAYEDRGLLIDNALFGFRAKYNFSPNLSMKVFTGQVKNMFSRYNPILKGVNVEGNWQAGKKTFMTTGVGAVNRTMDQASMDGVVSQINAMDTENRFVPRYNTFAGSFYNTMNVGVFTWYVEGAYKTREAIATPELKNEDGHVLYSTIGVALNKVGINASIKRTQNFVMRTSPNEKLIRGLFNWQPIIAQIRTQRVIARYSPQSQDVSEYAGGLNIFYTPNSNLSFTASGTYINTLNDVKLYREGYLEAEYRGWKNTILHLGAQYLEYNQAIYQQKPANTPIVKAITPFMELVYKIDKKKSIRTEWQVMNTHMDYGSWLFGLLEYNISPKWSFALTDMYNFRPEGINAKGKHHYPNVFIARTVGPHRFTAQYVKQVEGINCTGGVCRYEPAFSGFKFGITSTF